MAHWPAPLRDSEGMTATDRAMLKAISDKWTTAYLYGPQDDDNDEPAANGWPHPLRNTEHDAAEAIATACGWPELWLWE